MQMKKRRITAREEWEEKGTVQNRHWQTINLSASRIAKMATPTPHNPSASKLQCRDDMFSKCRPQFQSSLSNRPRHRQRSDSKGYLERQYKHNDFFTKHTNTHSTFEDQIDARRLLPRSLHQPPLLRPLLRPGPPTPLRAPRSRKAPIAHSVPVDIE